MNAAKREELFKLLCTKAAQVVAQGGDPSACVPLGSSQPEFFLDTHNEKHGSNVAIMSNSAGGLNRDNLPPIKGPLRILTPLFIGKSNIKDFPDFFSN